jgi:BASS family bile acid:Na+ symporter
LSVFSSAEEWAMTIQIVFNILVVVFTVANLAAMGLELDIGETLKTLRSPRFVVLTLVWGWVIGPALAYLVTSVLPLAEPQEAGLLLVSMAPAAPFFPIVVRKARGAMAIAAAFMLLATVGTVALMPLLAPLMIKGLPVNAWAIAKPLLTMVLLPLAVGLALRVRAAAVAAKLLPVVKQLGDISTVLVLVLTLVLYGRLMLSAVGSYAMAAQVFFVLGMTLAPYKVGFGLKLEQRSVMALGMCTRNIAAVFGVYLALPNPDPGLFVMLALVFPVTLIISFLAARFFSSRASGTAVAAAA